MITWSDFIWNSDVHKRQSKTCIPIRLCNNASAIKLVVYNHCTGLVNWQFLYSLIRFACL